MDKITVDFLKSEIVDVTYTKIGKTLTHCALTTKNGFIFTGESACVDETSFNEEIGKKVAYDRAFASMWLPYGFLLKQKNYEATLNANLDWKGRVEQELSGLRERADKLKAFISKPKPDFMEDDAWDLLFPQHDTMLKYIEILEKRLSLS